MTKVTSIAVLVKCSPKHHLAIQEHSRKTKIPMREIVDEALADWLTCVAPARLEAYEEYAKKIGRVSQNENSA